MTKETILKFNELVEKGRNTVERLRELYNASIEKNGMSFINFIKEIHLETKTEMSNKVKRLVEFKEKNLTVNDMSYAYTTVMRED